MAGVLKHPLISYQPFRLLFQVLYSATIAARLPLWVILSLVPSLRPHPKWTAKQALLRRVAYATTDIKSQIGLTPELSLQKGKEGDRFEVIDPSVLGDPAEYLGKLAPGSAGSNNMRPEPVGATWYPAAPLKERDDAYFSGKTVVLYLHGGAFVVGEGRDSTVEFPARTLIEQGGVDFVLALQYRLSGYGGQNPFPAALQDALVAYLYLNRVLGVPSRQIVVCGDSAGGNLAIRLLRLIEEEEDDRDIPAPGQVTLFSPWVAPFDYDIQSNPRFDSDFLPTSFLRWGAETYSAGLAGDPATDPNITPLGNPFTTSVPIFVNVGTHEVLFDSVRQWVKQMREVGGNVLELHEEEAGLHDTFLIGHTIGFEASAQQTVSAMGEFIRKYK